MKVTVELYIADPVSNDIDDLSDLVEKAVEEAIGEADYTVRDVGLSFEIDDQ